MPIYEYQGQRYDIADTDPDVAKSKILDYLAKQEAVPEYAPTPETGFIPSVKRGALGLQSLVADVLPAMAGRVGEKLGVEGAGEYATRQMQEAQEAQRYIQQMYPSAVPSYKDIKDVGTAVDYIVESVGELIPSILPTIFTGGAAGVIGRGAVIAAKQAAEKSAIAGAAKGLTEKEIKDLATQAGIDAAKKKALQYQAAGAIGGSAIQNVPEVYQNIAEETGKEDLGAALLFGGFNSVLDAITPIALLRKAKGIGLTEKELIGAWYKRAGKGAVSGFLTEGATEAVQEMSSAAAEKFVDNNKQFFTEKNFERFINAGLKGGIGGGAISGAANIPFGQAQPPAPVVPTEPTTAVTPTPEAATPAAAPSLSLDEALAKVKGAKKAEEEKALDVEETFDMVTTGERIATLKADNERIKNKLNAGQYPNKIAIDKANAKLKRQEEEIQKLEAGITQGGKDVITDRTDGTGSGVSPEVPSGPVTSGAAAEAAALKRSGVADAGGITEQAPAREAEQQPPLKPEEVLKEEKPAIVTPPKNAPNLPEQIDPFLKNLIEAEKTRQKGLVKDTRTLEDKAMQVRLAPKTKEQEIQRQQQIKALQAKQAKELAKDVKLTPEQKKSNTAAKNYLAAANNDEAAALRYLAFDLSVGAKGKKGAYKPGTGGEMAQAFYKSLTPDQKKIVDVERDKWTDIEAGTTSNIEARNKAIANRKAKQEKDIKSVVTQITKKEKIAEKEATAEEKIKTKLQREKDFDEALQESEFGFGIEKPASYSYYD